MIRTRSKRYRKDAGMRRKQGVTKEILKNTKYKCIHAKYILKKIKVKAR